jgi:iron(III) transport system permease protein
MSTLVLPRKGPSAPLVPALRRAWRSLTRAHVILGIVLILLMLYLVITPFLAMIQTTFTWQTSDQRITREFTTEGEFTLFHWLRMFNSQLSQTMVWTPLMNTLTVAITTSFLTLVIGTLLAWVVVRTDLPLRKLISSLAIIPYMLPSWAIGLAWLVVFRGSQFGGQMGFFQQLSGVEPPAWLSFGPLPIIVAQVAHYYAFAFLLASGALQSLDARLEESGEILGASRWYVLRRITIPLVTPAVLSALILTFSHAMSEFGTPAFLGSPIRYYVLSTSLFNNINSGLQADGFVLGLVLIAISIVTIYINQRVIGIRKSFVTIAGKGFTSTPVRLRALKYPILALVLAFLLLVVVAPLLLLFYQTLMLHVGDYSLSNLSLQYYFGDSNPRYAEGSPGIFRDPQFFQATWNSVALAIVTAIVTAVLGILLGYVIVKGRGTLLSKITEQLAFLPYLIPGIAFGAIYLGMFASPMGPIPALYGTFWLLVVVSVVKHLPFSSRSGTAAIMQVGSELEEAATIAGAAWVTRFRRIILPLSTSGLVSGFLLTFITTMRELSLIVLLVTPMTRTLTVFSFRYSQQGWVQYSDAVVIVIVAIVLVAEWLVRRVSGGSIAQGLGA